MFTPPSIPVNYSYTLGFHPDEYSYEVYSLSGLEYSFQFYDYAAMRQAVNKATRYGRHMWVVAVTRRGQRVFYTNSKRQKSLIPLHWRQSKGA